MSGYIASLGNTRRFAVAAGFCLIVAGGIVAVRRASATSDVSTAVTPLGNRLPELRLETIDGRSVSLRERLGGKAALIYVVGPADARNPDGLSPSVAAVRDEAPGLAMLLIGSGAPAGAFASMAKAAGVETSTLIDEHRSLLHALGMPAEPLVLLADSTGQILFVDSRSEARAARLPVGNILRGIHALIRSPSPPSPK